MSVPGMMKTILSPESNWNILSNERKHYVMWSRLYAVKELMRSEGNILIRKLFNHNIEHAMIAKNKRLTRSFPLRGEGILLLFLLLYGYQSHNK